MLILPIKKNEQKFFNALSDEKNTKEIRGTLKIEKLNLVMKSKLRELGWLNVSKLMYEIVIFSMEAKKLKTVYIENLKKR